MRTGCKRIPDGGHIGTSSPDEPHHHRRQDLERQALRRRSVGVRLSSSGSIRKGKSRKQELQKTIRNWKADPAGGRHSSKKRVQLPSDTSYNPWTILGSSRQTKLGTKNAYPETFGVHVLPQSLHHHPIVQGCLGPSHYDMEPSTLGYLRGQFYVLISRKRKILFLSVLNVFIFQYARGRYS